MSPRPDAQPPRPRNPSAPPPSAPVRTGTEAAFAALAAAVRKQRPILGSSLLQVRPIAFGPDGVILGCDNSFDEQQLSAPDVRAFLAAEVSAIFGRVTSVDVRRVDASDARPATLTEVEEGDRAARRAERNLAARENAAVRKALDVLGARIARVRVVEDD